MTKKELIAAMFDYPEDMHVEIACLVCNEAGEEEDRTVSTIEEVATNGANILLVYRV